VEPVFDVVDVIAGNNVRFKVINSSQCKGPGHVACGGDGVR
jgi:hypothetical protein